MIFNLLARLSRMQGGVLIPLLGVAALAGGGAGFMTKMPGVSFSGPLPVLSAEEKDLAHRLRQHVEKLTAGERNTAHPGQLENAAQYIETTLAGIGYTVRQQIYSVDGNRVRNLEVVVPPRSRPAGNAGVIVVGAHYDSAPGTPGANDNASGTAAVIELARALHQMPPTRGHEIRLVFFVNEEPPYFKTDNMGSLVHARDLQASGLKIIGMLSLETIGYYSDAPGSQRYPSPLNAIYPSTGNFLAFVGDLGSRDLVRQVIDAFRRNAAFPSEGIAAPASVPGVDWSDHWSYRQLGIPAMMVTDTAFYRYPEYHTANDTPDKLAYDRMALVVQGIALSLRELVTID